MRSTRHRNRILCHDCGARLTSKDIMDCLDMRGVHRRTFLCKKCRRVERSMDEMGHPLQYMDDVRWDPSGSLEVTSVSLVYYSPNGKLQFIKAV